MTVIPTTKVRLLSNVPLHNQYEHQMTFNNKAEQETYFLNRPSFSFTDFTYQREEQAIKVPKPYDELYHCNYVMYQNADYTNKWFYGFITKKEYVNPNTTRIYFELDVFQTWQFDLNWQPSYVIREHTKRWNDDGTPVRNTIDEGLDYGTEYETVHVQKYKPFDNLYFLVVVSKGVLHDNPDTSFTAKDIVPTVNGLPQPLSYYIHPFRLDGTTPSVRIDGTGISISPIEKALQNMFTQDSAVNNIVSLYVTDFFGKYVIYNGTSVELDGEFFSRGVVADNKHENINTVYVKKMPPYESITEDLGSKYTGFYTHEESKLYMYPYMVTVLDDMKGNRLEVKNEYIKGKNLVLRVKGSLGTNNKVSYSIDNYLTDENLPFDSMFKISLEHSLINQDPNDLPILSDYLSAYLQGNKNTLQNQRDSMIFSSLSGIIGGAIGGGIGAIGGTAYTMGQSYYQIQGLNAKLKDIDNTPPSLSKMGSNAYFDYGNDVNGVYVIKKQITAEYRKRLGDYFKMFGYKVNTLKVPNLKTRRHFNYIQTAAANIFGNVPMDDMNKIKEMFNKGVTLWHGDWVGDYSKVNDEL